MFLETATDILYHVASRKIMKSATFKSPVVEVIVTYFNEPQWCSYTKTKETHKIFKISDYPARSRTG
jgi:hypothetical protein